MGSRMQSPHHQERVIQAALSLLNEERLTYDRALASMEAAVYAYDHEAWVAAYRCLLAADKCFQWAWQALASRDLLIVFDHAAGRHAIVGSCYTQCESACSVDVPGNVECCRSPEMLVSATLGIASASRSLRVTNQHWAGRTHFQIGL